MNHLRAIIQPGETGALSFIASTSGVKRDGYSLDISGLSTDNYLRNPVFLWAHDYWGLRPPIGRVTEITKDFTAGKEDLLRVTVDFDQADPFAREIERKYRDGYLNAVSIGWESLEMKGDSITRSDLLDVSAVPVPGDADALIQRMSTESLEWHAAILGRLKESLTATPPIVEDDPVDSPEGVSADPPDNVPDLRGATVEQLDTLIDSLTEWKATLSEEDSQPPGTPDMLEGLLIEDLLQALEGESNE